ncbi:Heavy metal tolerance protein, partial [Penicillium subrubescens]
VRIVTLVSQVLIYTSKSGLLASKSESLHDQFNEATETTRLLDSSGGNHMNSQIPEPVHDGSQDPSIHRTTFPFGNKWKYLMGYSIFLPYMWPSKSHGLKLVRLACLFLLVVQRINNVMTPILVGVIITALANQQEAHAFYVVWPQITLYVFSRWLQTGLSSLRSALWIPVSQYSRMELSTAAFEHVHNLGLDFHRNKKTGEVLSALNKGKSVTGLLEQVVFEFIPTLLDLFIAIGYFLIAFDAYYALVVGISSFGYIYVTIRMGLWRAQTRREMVNASRYEDAVKNESVVAYETVKLFNAEQHEFHRYRTAVRDYQKTEYYSSLRGTVLNTVQNTVLMTGLLCTCFIAAYQVSTVQQPVGLFVTLLMYMAQPQGPLGYLGSFYASIQSSLINAERILELFREQSTVVDSKLATPLVACKGEIRFQNVQFFYDDRKVLFNGLTFTCKPGTTTALVGESGVGKSTIFQILYRFYNPADGSVHVDGYDVRDLTGDSIRKHVSIVPQHLALFNESLMYNLNGGEKQRVAIARTILKNTRIILLDEATSALDAGSETFIQRSLKAFSYDRTILVIAHRLSTITAADCILVLHEGRVVERGTHAELLELNGRYAEMWRNHTRE